ncbi:MAG: hypothetical protein C0445_05105 [Polaromonas sp.]|nr:hypothetical protein [Polaromonas sp.]
MATQLSLSNVDVMAWARSGMRLDGEWSQAADAAALAARFPRLLAEACVPQGLDGVTWALNAELRADQAGESVPWLHVRACATVQLVCQRCLGPAPVALDVDRWFRFVKDEDTAAAEDDESEEDVLALLPRMDVGTLLEDELLMAIPLVPMHGECPVPVTTAVEDEDFWQAASEKPHPFAALNQLKGKATR